MFIYMASKFWHEIFAHHYRKHSVLPAFIGPSRNTQEFTMRDDSKNDCEGNYRQSAIQRKWSCMLIPLNSYIYFNKLLRYPFGTACNDNMAWLLSNQCTTFSNKMFIIQCTTSNIIQCNRFIAFMTIVKGYIFNHLYESLCGVGILFVTYDGRTVLVTLIYSVVAREK